MYLKFMALNIQSRFKKRNMALDFKICITKAQDLKYTYLWIRMPEHCSFTSTAVITMRFNFIARTLQTDLVTHRLRDYISGYNITQQ